MAARSLAASPAMLLAETDGEAYSDSDVASKAECKNHAGCGQLSYIIATVTSMQQELESHGIYPALREITCLPVPAYPNTMPPSCSLHTDT